MLTQPICSAQRYLLLTLLVCLGTCVAVDGSHLTGNESRNDLRAIICATKGEPVGPELMLEVLKRYHETFGEYDYENVKSIIELANVDQSKCNGPAFREINEQFEKKKNCALNMVPYLIDVKRRQFKVCRDLLSHKMLEAVEDLSKKQVLQLENFMKSVQEVKQAPVVEPLMTFDDWHDQMKSILLVWIKRQFDLKPVKDRESFERKKRNEFSSCYSILREFTGPIQAYEAVMDDSEIVQLIDIPTLNWITRYNLCSSIVKLDYSQLVNNEESKKKSKSIWKNSLFKPA